MKRENILSPICIYNTITFTPQSINRIFQNLLPDYILTKNAQRPSLHEFSNSKILKKRVLQFRNTFDHVITYISFLGARITAVLRQSSYIHRKIFFSSQFG